MLVVSLAVVLAACGGSAETPPEATSTVGVCVGVSDATPAGTQAQVEAVQDGEVSASASITVPGAALLPVPSAAGDVQLRVNGQWAGGGMVEGGAAFAVENGADCPSPEPWTD
ncbi:hypothetical protein ACFEMC_10550 [Kineococcus sp. DHX-1]|uniref:hypothetical protein n=1 Tax=Kineococcus sp. DHX-1 TaxID=3349638 RepID=UPI0036D43753